MHAAERRRRDLAILARYHEKVSRSSYTYRKRGSPKNLIEAVARLHGGKACVQCGSLDNPELHHVNKNWRDYSLSNVQFYCHRCHMAAHHKLRDHHKEHTMSRQRWTSEKLAELRNEVNRLGVDGLITREEVYRQMATQKNKPWFGMSPYTIENYFYGKPERQRAHRAHGRQSHGTERVVPLSKILRMLLNAERAGIVIDVEK